jgi:outer membrane lipoprotein-sorting protein
MRAVMNQSFGPGRRSGGLGAGLSMLRNNYVASFVSSPYPEPLDGSGERVIRLRLTRRTASEGFREIILSVNPDTRLIRRMEGTTIGDSIVRFDFTNIRINQGIPEQRFVFDPPAGASMYPNFLFRID